MALGGRRVGRRAPQRLLAEQVQGGPLLAEVLLGIVIFSGAEAVEALVVAKNHANLGLPNLI